MHAPIVQKFTVNTHVDESAYAHPLAQRAARLHTKDENDGKRMASSTSTGSSTSTLDLTLEWSIHHPPSTRYLSELRPVFPELFPVHSSPTAGPMWPRVTRETMLVVPTFQPCLSDLVGVGVEQEREKDDKLEGVSYRV